MLEQAARMRNLLSALTDGVETVVAKGNFAARKAGQQCPHRGGAFPGEDALGALDPTEDSYDRAHRGRICGPVHDQGRHVITQGAACTSTATVNLAFGVTGSTSVVLGDARACQTYRLGIGTVGASRQQAIVSATGADAVGAHRGVKAAVAQLLSGPGRGAVLDRHAAATCTRDFSLDVRSSASATMAATVIGHRGSPGLGAGARIC